MPSDSEQRDRPASFPRRVGSYELLLPIASGGMGTVYLARKRGPGGYERDVALKLTHAFLREQPEWSAQLVEEAKLASRIHHPNVVQVLDVDDDPVGVFLVMQYVEGDTLYGLLRHARRAGARLPVDIGLRILLDALAGLHAAHELRDEQGRPLGLVHRDFTPQNILVGTDGVSRLTDFGVAKAASRIGATRTGIIKGKAAYMAPEQVRAQPVDRRADVWAAGVVAWELFAGRRMRPATDDQAAMLLQVATEVPPRLGAVWPGAPAEVDEVIAQALALDRAARCPTVHRFAELLERAWSDVTLPATPGAVAEYVRAAVGDAVAGRRQEAARLSSERSNSTDGSLVTPAPAAASMPGARRVRSTAVVAGIAAIALSAVGLAVVRARAPHEEPLPSSNVEPVASATAPGASPSTHALHILSDVPVSEVRIDGRATVLSAPATDVTLETPGGALTQGLVIEGVASDGRRATALLGADPTIVTLSFPAPPPATPIGEPPVAAPARSPRRPPPVSARPPAAPSQAVPLAKSPYE